MTDPCIHGPGVDRCGHPDCVGEREFGHPVLRELRVRCPETHGALVTTENARHLATLCGGWTTADLRWRDGSTPIWPRGGYYLYPADHPQYPNGSFGSMSRRVEGVMLPYGVVAPFGWWMVVNERAVGVGGHWITLDPGEAAQRYVLP